MEGSSDGLAASVRSLSPGRLCLTHSVRVEFRRLFAISLLGLAFLAPLGLTVVFCQIQWRRSARKLLRFPCGWGLSVLSLDRVLLISSLFSPGRSLPGLSWVSTSPVWSSGCFWRRGACLRPVVPFRLLASSHSGVCAMRVGVPPCSLTRCSTSWLVPSGLAILAHYRWSRVHGRSSAGLLC